MKKAWRTLLAGCGLLTTVTAQAPKLWMQARTSVAPAIVPSLLTSPQLGAPYAIFFDVASGPVHVLGVEVQLGFTPVMNAPHVGVIGPAASVHGTQLPNNLPHGLTVYGQAFVLDPTAPGGLLRASNGGSTVLCDTFAGCDFTMRVQDDYTGTFVQGYQQLIAAAPVAGNAFSDATSPWLPGSSIFLPTPDYGAPLVAKVQPFDTDIQIEWRGAVDATGLEATLWAPSPDIADGLPFLQFRATFRASLITGARPILTNVVVPAY